MVITLETVLVATDLCKSQTVILVHLKACADIHYNDIRLKTYLQGCMSYVKCTTTKTCFSVKMIKNIIHLTSTFRTASLIMNVNLCNQSNAM